MMELLATIGSYSGWVTGMMCAFVVAHTAINQRLYLYRFHVVGIVTTLSLLSIAEEDWLRGIFILALTLLLFVTIAAIQRRRAVYEQRVAALARSAERVSPELARDVWAVFFNGGR